MLETLTLSTAHILLILIFIMITWTFLLIVLCSALAPALCCGWLGHYRHHSNNSLTLIRIMGGPLTEDDSPVSYPYKLYRDMHNTNEVETQLVFIRDSLKQIFELYHRGNLSSVTWDTNRVHQFLQSINRQTEELSQCVSSTKRADRRLRKYYRRLAKKTLYRTGFSAESWELIRNETKQNLDLLDLLVNRIRRRST